MARRGEQVGGELEHRAIVVLKPAQHVHERLLRRVRSVLRGARQSQAVVEDLLRVAVVQLAVRDPAARSSFLDEYGVGGGGPAMQDGDSGHESRGPRYAHARCGQHGFEHGAKRLDHSRVELRPGTAAQLLERGVLRGRAPVRARVRHRVECVAYRDDPGWKRDGGTLEAIGIAVAVPALVRCAHQTPEPDQHGPSLEDLLADHRVPLHQGTLVMGERPGLLEHPGRYRELSDVVYARRSDHDLEQRRIQAEFERKQPPDAGGPLHVGGYVGRGFLHELEQGGEGGLHSGGAKAGVLDCVPARGRMHYASPFDRGSGRETSGRIVVSTPKSDLRGIPYADFDIRPLRAPPPAS